MEGGEKEEGRTRLIDEVYANMSAGRDSRRLKERSRSSRVVLPLKKLVGSPPLSTDREFLEILRTLRPVRWLKAPKGIMERRLRLRLSTSRLTSESKTPSERLLMYFPEKSRVPLCPWLDCWIDGWMVGWLVVGLLVG